MDTQVFEHKKLCERCNVEVLARLVRTIAQNGANQVYWWCISGNHKLARTAHFIPHDILRQYNIEPNRLPIMENYSHNEPCIVCGNPMTELHHFAPRYLFEDADKWPTAYLCKPHHKQWHDRVTPNMCENKREK